MTTSARSNVTGIVFDFDGVLVDSNSIKRDAYFHAFNDWPGARAVVAEVVDVSAANAGNRYDVIDEILASLTRAGVASSARKRARLTLSLLAERYSAYCGSRVRDCPEIKGAEELLVRLSTTLPLYVNSATPEVLLRDLVEHRNWTRFFRLTCGSPNDKVVNLRRIADEAGHRPAELVFVGDSEPDQLASSRFGCSFIALIREPGRFRSTPDVAIERLDDIERWLEVLSRDHSSSER